MDWMVIGVVLVVVILLLIKSVKPISRSVVGYELRETLLSKAERSFFGVLQQAVSDNVRVFAKVRVADVIKPEKGLTRSSWQVAFNRISSKHFDFILCDDETLSFLAVLELQDSSHDTRKRRERDEFLRRACATAGVPLLEFKAKRSYSIQQLTEDLSTVTQRPLNNTREQTGGR